MRVHILCGLFIVVCTVLLSSCGGPPKLDWKAVDRLNFNAVEGSSDFHIPVRDLYEYIYFSRVAAAGGPVTDSMITSFRDSLLTDTLMGLSTEKFDLTSHWYQYREYRDRVSAALRQAFWDKEVATKMDVDSQEVIKYYQEHTNEFLYPEQVDVYHILSSPLGFRQGPDSALVDRYSRQQLDDFSEVFIWRLYDLLVNGEVFENVARKYSHDVRSREKGGHLGWVKRGVYLDPFDSVAFNLKDGDFSEPYTDGDGWHILYRSRYNPGGPLPLDSPSVYVQAHNSVFNAKGSAMADRIIDSLRKASSVVINDLILSDTVIYLVDDTVWAAVINQTDTVDVLRLKGLEEDYRRSYGVGNTTPDIRRIMVAHVAGPVVVEQAARFQGLDTLPKQVEIKKQYWREAAKAQMIANLYAKNDWNPTDSAVEQYYQDHFEEYNPDLHFTAEQIVVQDQELAHFLREQIASGFTLKYLTEYYGKGEGYDIKYENLGTVNESTVDSSLFDAMKRTHAYRFTGVIKTKRGYHIARILERTYPRPLEVVRGEIRNKLIAEYRHQQQARYQDSLFQSFDIRFPGTLPPFELPMLSKRNHPRTIPRAVVGSTL
jgi:hypothetical protein